MAFLTVKEVSQWLSIKPSTLYLWAGQGKIPCIVINGLIRFQKEELDTWLSSFRDEKPASRINFSKTGHDDIDTIIARAKKDLYTPRYGETRPTSSPHGKEERDGAL